MRIKRGLRDWRRSREVSDGASVAGGGGKGILGVEYLRSMPGREIVLCARYTGGFSSHTVSPPRSLCAPPRFQHLKLALRNALPLVLYSQKATAATNINAAISSN